MNNRPLDVVRRGVAVGERTRREMLRLLSGAGIGLGSLTALTDARAEPIGPSKKPKKKAKGDARCQCREVLSTHGTCIDVTDPVALFAAQCTPTFCYCIAETNGGPRDCVQLSCESSCVSDDDCPGDAYCGNTAGCCVDHPEYARTCVTSCPSV